MMIWWLHDVLPYEEDENLQKIPKMRYVHMHVNWCFTINHDEKCNKKKTCNFFLFFQFFIKTCQKHEFKHTLFLGFSGAFIWLLFDFYWLILDFNWLLDDFSSHSRVKEKSTKSQFFLCKSQQKVNFKMMISKSQLQGVKRSKSWLFPFVHI